ncbi:MAG: phosphoserine phosphatase SerB [Deltaproteobacteria bacterium]|nr:phosphoserine phosphatase SerB [Deltaproteobacteria bacterium]
MFSESISKEKDIYVISVIGEDRVGIVSEVTGFLFERGVNIIDIEQTVIHSQFTMVLLIHPLRPGFRLNQLRVGLNSLSRRLEMKITVTPLHEFKGMRLAETKRPYVLTILGTDRPGVVTSLSSMFARHHCNIERIKMIARGELLAMEMSVDLRQAHFPHLSRDISEVAKQIGMDIVAQPEHLFKKRKKVIVFDMDSTIVDGEIIDEMAKVAGVGDKVAAITEKGMRGEVDFKRSLRARVSLLKGLRIKSLESIVRTLKFTKGSEELVAALAEMGFKVALISGGFTYFTDLLKKRLGFDYAFGNELEIRNGKLTGKVRGKIIDARRKAEIMDEICRKEGVTRDEVVAVGDGSNDRIMVANAGLGIAFNAKEILKKVADGAITRDHMKGVLYCLGITELDLRKKTE